MRNGHSTSRVQAASPTTLTPSAKTRHLGIHGARGTGKTCYLACLYGRRSTERAALVFRDNDTIDHLDAIWSILEQGDLPEATAVATPTTLHMELNSQGLSWNIVTQDYAGSLVQRFETGVPELKEDVRNWLKSCHAILLFVNIDADERSLRERHNELDLLITELKRLSPDGNTIARPLALLLTKWDILGQPSNDPERERERAWRFLLDESSPQLRQIADALRNCGDRVEIFPVSSFGSHREGNKPPLEGPHPIGHLDPLVWALEKTDQMLLERAEREAERHAGPHLWWWQKDYRAAERSFRHLIHELGVNKGPLYQKAHVEWQTWRNKLYLRRIRQWTATFIFLMFFGLVGLCREDNSPYRHALAVLSDPSTPIEEVQQTCQAYQNRWNPIGRWLGRSQEILGKWQDYLENVHECAFRVLEDFRAKHPTEEYAQQRIEMGEEFLKKWPTSPHTPEVDRWLQEDKRLYQQYQEDRDYRALENYREKYSREGDAEQCAKMGEEFLNKWPHSSRAPMVRNWVEEDRKRFQEHMLVREYQHLLAKLETMGDNYDEMAKLCIEFLGKFNRDQYPRKSNIFEDIERRREEYTRKQDEKYWQAVVNYEQQNPYSYDEIIRRAKAYADRPMARYRKEAFQMIERTEVRWDEAEYDKVRRATSEARDPNTFLAAERVARGYLNSPHPRKGMKANVEKWLEWFENLKQKKTFYITVKSISIPDGSDLAESLTTEDPCVHIELNGTKHSTRWYSGRNPQINERLGPFHYQWGQKGKLIVQVEEHDTFFFDPNDWAEGTASDDTFVLFKANGTFTVICKKGKEIPVNLECPDLNPPSLPPYAK